ncbi:anti-sigma factor [Roseovarius aestuariivivens]|uniref:anti-sigma factor n=1 Tax=Roseovarius aestuariivivens TaxID=1888910 RepID=UPI001436859A|nr:anti-sigma factor [Roseovarius aestuariivivens]
MSPTADPAKDDSLLAAEYVLRLLRPREERAFERRLLEDHRLAQQVAGWTARFSGMNAEIAEITPPRSAKKGLQTRLFGKVEEAVPLWRRLGLWQGLSFASVALAAFFAMQIVQMPGQTPPQAQDDRGALFLSEVAAEDQSLRVLAVYDSAAGRLQITRTAGAAAPGRVLELWAIAGENAPVSLGVLPETGKGGVILPEGLRAQVAGLTLAISDEPPGGSPTGAPTGAVLAVGQVTRL